jgi:[NiFe] hydrogenase assembly HybE family chaperone
MNRWQSQLEQHYQQIYDHTMKDLPICNHRLQIALLDWRALPDIGFLGVMITPWFISLVVQPTQIDAFAHIRAGQTIELSFPSGQYEFMVNHQPFGDYGTCALLSETTNIESHEVACQLAEQMLTYLFEPCEVEAKPEPAPRSVAEAQIQAFNHTLEQPVSRRALFGLAVSAVK